MAKDPDKTEKATPRRREKAREEGQVAKSMDIAISASLITVFLTLLFYIPFAFERLYKIFIHFFSDPLHNIPEYNYAIIYEIVKDLAILLLPIFGLLLIIGIFSNVAQFGFLFTFKPLIPKLEKIDPISGLKRIFSLKTLFELFKNLLKLIVATVVSYYLVSYLLEGVLRFAATGIYDDAYLMMKYTLIMILGFALLSIPVSVIDFFFRKYEFEENIKMSKQEIKEEQKLYEGNPQIKSAIRKKMREMSLTRMMAEVAKADVVITNPEHYAVALKYERGKMQAPKVVAKGVDRIALRIKEEARLHNVPIEENPPLARALYQACDIGDFVPESLYQAIAKIFAKIYKKQGLHS
ncbi:flagellar biosynthesis protein FlhB [Nitratiruptor tergarcus]|uniref:Flagellar biosynthetic protein FlhB n=1 Tax=Nitratiruptor tergarcus DSM 16512 TaxID=1069081 RepID=A0A1W1WSL5_9BACT|nr:flagellar biosynthesis protein FlhB [Nitratiruptor tergarcus]SMC09301.1 flagellar biosynthetic protein FlhB [Nitratiruptor tergarcus DSM 16512]